MGVNFAISSTHATRVDLCLFDTADNAAFAPLAAVIDPAFPWGDDRPPRTPWHKTVISEAHIKGFTKQHPGIPDAVRGTYEALTTEPAIEHLQRLGVTAVELMPVDHQAYDRHLVDRGLANYWGYNTLGFFAPDIRYSADGEPASSVAEFNRMVKAIHEARSTPCRVEGGAAYTLRGRTMALFTLEDSDYRRRSSDLGAHG